MQSRAGKPRAIVTAREMLEEVLAELPEDRIGEVLDFARLLGTRPERETWAKFGREQLARAYGDSEPVYTDADLDPELNQ
jgi:hypothetical protein